MSHLWPLILWSEKGGCCCPCFYTDHRCTWMWKSQNRTNPFKYRSSFHRLACVGFRERGKKEKKALKARHSVCNKQKTMSATENTCTVESSRESTQSASDLMKAVTLHSFWQYVPKSGASQNKNHKKTSFLCRSTHIYWVLLTDM